MSTSLAIIEEMQSDESRELSQVENATIYRLLANARAKNTNLAYGRAWAKFESWTREHGFTPIPAAPTTVALYLDHLNVIGRKSSTLEQAIAGITAMHADNGLTANLFKNHLIASTLKACKRSMVDDGRSNIEKPRALSQAEIGLMAQVLDGSPAGLRDRALFLLGCNSGLRAAEYARLQLVDITFDELGMDIRIRSSKTDQLGEGETVYVASLAPAQRSFDAVHAMRQWFESRKLLDYGDGSVFIAFRRGGMTPHLDGNQLVHGLTREAVSNIVERLFTRADLEGKLPSSHSLRHSFITQAFSRNLDASRISRVSRHKNLRVLQGYDQTSRKSNPVAPVLWA